MQNKKIVVGFDFDGVLVNSLDVMEKSWNRLSLKYDISIPFLEYKKCIGLKFQMILDEIGVDKDLHEIIYKEYFDGTKEYKDEVQLYPGVEKTLNELKDNSIPTFIVTSKPRSNTIDLLNKFNIKVDMLVCADDVENGKPHRESGDRIINNFNDSEFFYIGDMDSDKKFADNCNFKFIFANYGYGKINTRSKYKIDSIYDIFNYITL